MRVESFGITDVGRKRGHNEDSFVENTTLNLFAVADGMGGHEAGEVASKLALDILGRYVSERKHIIDLYERTPNKTNKKKVFSLLVDGVHEACRKIYEMAQEQSQKRGMGTTLSALLIAGGAAFIVHVGDSRVYLLRKGRAHQLTEDHTLLNEQIKRGMLTEEEAKNFRYKNVITRAVGIMESVPADTFFLELAERDRFLLCSDGLHGYFSDTTEVAKFMSTQDMEEASKKMIEFANSKGGKDNITVVMVDVMDVATKRVDASLRMEILQGVKIFEGLQYQDLVRFVNVADTISVKRGEMIVREGERGDSFYVILSGEVEVSSGGVFITALKERGHFGEMALIDDNVRSATITASKPCELLVVKRKGFASLLNQEPKIASRVLLNISRTLSARLRETTKAFAAARKQVIEKGTVI